MTAARGLVVGALLAFLWPLYSELRRAPRAAPAEWALGAAAGVAVFLAWIALADGWVVLGEPREGFRPLGPGGGIDWALALARLAGLALVVPVMEELFWRSFLMRWIERPQFESVVPQRIGLRAVVLSTFVFTLAHTLWLAAVIAGLAYAWLYVRTGKLWVPIASHAVTNGVLGVWVVTTGNWDFW